MALCRGRRWPILSSVESTEARSGLLEELQALKSSKQSLCFEKNGSWWQTSAASVRRFPRSMRSQPRPPLGPPPPLPSITTTSRRLQADSDAAAGDRKRLPPCQASKAFRHSTRRSTPFARESLDPLTERARRPAPSRSLNRRAHPQRGTLQDPARVRGSMTPGRRSTVGSTGWAKSRVSSNLPAKRPLRPKPLLRLRRPDEAVLHRLHRQDATV